MLDQRRHQRIRFGVQPGIKIGFDGAMGDGLIENLSLSGLMVRTELPLEISRMVGCEFSLFQSPMIDVPAVVVSRVGDLYGLRFQQGPISQVLIEDSINTALAAGQAAILSMHEAGGKRVMRIVGGLSGALRSDFMHALTRVGVDEIDLSGVTAVDQAGVALCIVASGRHGARIGEQSPCFAETWKQALAVPGGTDAGDGR